MTMLTCLSQPHPLAANVFQIGIGKKILSRSV
jgi:hypothetical protein